MFTIRKNSNGIKMLTIFNWTKENCDQLGDTISFLSSHFLLSTGGCYQNVSLRENINRMKIAQYNKKKNPLENLQKICYKDIDVFLRVNLKFLMNIYLCILESEKS